MPTDPDGPADALARLAADHDPQAWAWLVAHHGPGMHRLAARILGDATDAADACQEAFLHLRRGARRFVPPRDGDADAAATAWILRVTANASRMWARARQRRRVHEADAATVPGHRPEARPDVDGLRLALEALPDDLRQPIVLHHLAGQDYVAVGSALGISPGAARVRVHRGLERLRAGLARVGVAGVAVALLDRLAAAEPPPMPPDLVARCTSLLANPLTPAAPSTAIFGGLSIMTKLALSGLALAAAGLTAISIIPSHAEEPNHPPVAAPGGDAPRYPSLEPKKERHDAMAEGTKGTSTGTIVKIEKGRLLLRTTDGVLLFMPHWRGGMPKEGGGHDKATLEAMGRFKAGQQVRIAWTWSERRRIETIDAELATR
jgi:RNA polymerase sigma-70 factor (ECF subfamily)